MKIMFKYIMFSLTAGIFSCSNENPIINPPPPELKPVFVQSWESRLDETKEIVGTDFTQFYNDWVLVSGDIGDPFTLFSFNKTSGDKEWTFINEGEVDDEILISQLYENFYIGITNKGVVAVDLDLQERKWEIPFRSLGYNSNNGNYIHNGYLYHNFSVGGVGLGSEAAAIVKIKLEDGSFEEIYRTPNDIDGLKSTSPATVYAADNGHEIMLFNERPNAELAPQNVRQEIVAWDITSGLELWRSMVNNSYASNGLHAPIVYNGGIVITGGDWSIYAFDINSGENLWKTSMPGYTQWGIWNTTNHLIKDDRLYVNEGGHQIHCLNPLDGSFIWQNLDDAPNCTDNMIYYEKEDYLVFTSWGLGSVMIIDALTGELVHRERPSDDSTYNNDPVYDPETDMFFTSTYKNAIGFKINRPE